MIDVDDEIVDAANAAARTTVGTYFYWHNAERKAEARNQLRRMTEYKSYLKEDGSADVILERIWNILLGN